MRKGFIVFKAGDVMRCPVIKVCQDATVEEDPCGLTGLEWGDCGSRIDFTVRGEGAPGDGGAPVSKTGQVWSHRS